MSKLFLNMVIHDLRNPTSSIKLGLEDISINVQDIEKIYADQMEVIDIQSKFNKRIKDNIDTFCKISCQSLKNQDFVQMPLDGSNTKPIESIQMRMKYMRECFQEIKDSQQTQFDKVAGMIEETFVKYNYHPFRDDDLGEEYRDFEEAELDELS